jgi:teneurin
MPDVQYKYYMVVSPLDGRLYITDQQNLRIIRVKTMGPVRELAHNFEVIAGTGHQCVPGSADHCGDGGPATEARLFYPKGLFAYL